MSTVGVPLNIGQLPYSCYPGTPQTLYADMFSRARALYPSITGVIISASSPAAEDSDKLWIKTSGGSPVGHFIRFNAQWVWPHPVSAVSSFRSLWIGNLTDLQTADGGSAGTVGDASGPMWEEDTAFQDRNLMGAGTTVAVAVNYGPNSFGISNANLPFTRLKMFQSGILGPGATSLTATDSCRVGVNVEQSEDYVIVPGATPGTEPDLGLTSSFGQASPTTISLENPSRGIYVVKRTARIYLLG